MSSLRATAKIFEDVSSLPVEKLQLLVEENSSVLDSLGDEVLLQIMEKMTPKAVARFCKASVRVRRVCDERKISHALTVAGKSKEEKLRVKFFMKGVILGSEYGRGNEAVLTNSKRYFMDPGAEYKILYSDDDHGGRFTDIGTRHVMSLEEFSRVITHSLLDTVYFEAESDLGDNETIGQKWIDISLDRGYGFWFTDYFALSYRLFEVWVKKVGYKMARKTLDSDINVILFDSNANAPFP